MICVAGDGLATAATIVMFVETCVRAEVAATLPIVAANLGA